MGEPVCDALTAELALDRVDAELAAQLPGHMRAFARAYAGGEPEPAAPPVARRPATLAAARAALAHDVLVDRALPLWRLVGPIAIEDDPAVARARAAERTWAGLAVLAAARDAASGARFGLRAIPWLHELHGSTGPASDAPPPGPPIAGWHDRDAALPLGAITEAWRAIAARLGVDGDVRIELARASVHPRTFVVVPGADVIVVVPPATDSPAARFAVLHELGHAACALANPVGVSRALDEAAAASVARLCEPGSWLGAPWETPLASAARARRRAVAALLDRVERALPALSETAGARPPWALWHDPGAQAAYVAAEAIVDGGGVTW